MGVKAPAEAGLARRSACGGVGTAMSLVWGEASLTPVKSTHNLSFRAPALTLYSRHVLSQIASARRHGKAVPQMMCCMQQGI